jgi:class 3 adenylate cyclase
MMDLDEAAKAVEKLAGECLFGEAFEDLSPFAEQHALAAYALLRQAEAQLKLAALHEARAIGERQMGRQMGL